MKGDVVGRIQKRLYELGYYDQDITEYYGPFTRDAIKAFQKALGVLPTGIATKRLKKRSLPTTLRSIPRTIRL